MSTCADMKMNVTFLVLDYSSKYSYSYDIFKFIPSDNVFKEYRLSIYGTWNQLLIVHDYFQYVWIGSI